MKKKNTANDKADNQSESIVFYIAIVAALLVLLWVFFGTFQKGSPAAANTYAQGLAAGNNNCGNISDLANVQHLSHHPGTFAECIKKVDPALFAQATGKDLGTYMAQNGIN